MARKKMSYRIWRISHLLTYLVFPITLIHTIKIGTYFSSIFISTYIYVIFSLFILIVLYKFLHFASILGNRYVITKIEDINSEIYLVHLKPTIKKIKIKGGQFIQLRLNPFGESHPFSVLDFDETTGEIALGIKKVGKFTNQLKQLKEGSFVNIDVGYGVFTKEAYNTQNKRIVLVAGGIGITPFISYLKYISQAHNNYEEVFLFFANRNLSSISFMEYLNSLSIPNLKVVFCFSDEENDHPYEKGRVNVILMNKYLSYSTSNYQYYICGPEGMMNSLAKDLELNGVDKANIFKEEFGW
ncbi:MAG: FAD-binding oxidoreductase [Candidatus Dojkabacteria bacterium]|nr:FAD-binding oxidoreductase [Candidatus Dojkabacteria bacterium]MDQ7021160.1 FAD-binding oxidoreductase [Candidatus Dojkabacteria bacterium]